MNHKSILTALVVAFLLGGIEARVAIGRVEATVDGMKQRVDRIERELDSQKTYAAKDE